MIISTRIALAVCASLAGIGAAEAGACYRKVATAPVYGAVNESYLVRPATTVARVIPAEYAERSERVMIRPAQTIAHRVPAIVQTVAQPEVVGPARRVWTVRRDAWGHEVGCWTELPAPVVTRFHTVVVQSESVSYETIPAEYGTVTRTVVVRPASVVHETVPAVYGVRSRNVVVEPGRVGWSPIDDCGY